MFVFLNVIVQGIHAQIELREGVHVGVLVDAVCDSAGVVVPLTDVLLHQALEFFAEDLLDELVFVAGEDVQQFFFVY